MVNSEYTDCGESPGEQDCLIYQIKNEGVMTTMENKKPFIHLFRTSQDYFMYDVNRDQIVRLPEAVYCDLKADAASLGSTAEAAAMISGLKERGFLKVNRVEEVEHPETEKLPILLQNSLSQLILQVTQRCNLNCHYCAYSGGYANRTHSQKDMTFDTAKAAMDYFIAHSKDSERLAVSFYGGEPLLKMDLIKECIAYCRENMEGKPLAFNLTTNGTLLTEPVMRFLVQENVRLLISLDGPQEIHDRNRRFAKSDKGSYEVVIRNLKLLKERYPDFYKDHVSFNAVMDTKDGFKCINDFVMGSDLFRDSYFGTSTISPRYAEEKVAPATEQFWIEWEYEIFKLFLSKLNRLQPSLVSNVVKIQFQDMCAKRLGKRLESAEVLPKKWHHGGPCTPGALRLFVNAEGRFYPCERVSEMSEVACLGDISCGVDCKKADTILNIERTTHEKCKNCWAYRYCGVCIAAVDGLNCVDGSLAADECIQTKDSLEYTFANYCVLADCGYDFMDEQLKKTLLV